MVGAELPLLTPTSFGAYSWGMEQGPFGNQQLSSAATGSPAVGNRALGNASIAVENARFMSRVYGWMAGGLCLTGAVAWNVAGNPDLVQMIFGNRLLFWGLIIAQLGAVVALSGLINRINALTATLIYFVYAGLTGPVSYTHLRAH